MTNLYFRGFGYDQPFIPKIFIASTTPLSTVEPPINSVVKCRELYKKTSTNRSRPNRKLSQNVLKNILAIIFDELRLFLIQIIIFK